MSDDLGWIKLFRKIKGNPAYRKPGTMYLFIHCLLSAAHKPYRTIIGGKAVTIEAGQFVAGRKAIANETGLSEKVVRNGLKTLTELFMIEMGPAKGQACSIITICNWETYQGTSDDEGQQRASKGPAKGQQRATIQEHKEFTERDIYARNVDSGDSGEKTFKTPTSPADAFQTTETTNDTPNTPNVQQRASGDAYGASAVNVPAEIEAVAFETYGGTAPMTYLREWIGTHETQWIIEALKRTQAAGARNPRYTDSILAKWKLEGYPALEANHGDIRATTGKAPRNYRASHRETTAYVDRTGERFGSA